MLEQRFEKLLTKIAKKPANELRLLFKNASNYDKLFLISTIEDYIQKFVNN
jgi:hypothetical protein